MNETLLDNSEQKIDPNKNYFDELVGEGRKFKDKEALAYSKINSDHYIKTLEQKMDELRADYLQATEENKAKAKLEELLDQIQQKQSGTSNNTQNTGSQTANTSFDPEKIESLVSKKMQEYETNSRQRENFRQVQERLKERFGDNSQSVIKNKMNDLGLTEEDVNSMAKRNPSLFYEVMGLNRQTQQQLPNLPRSSNVSSTQKPGERERTLSYYHELKKTNPKLYHDPKINIQMDKDVQRLGAAFFDVD